MQSTEQKIERAALAGLAAANMDERERSTDISLAELAALVETAGGQPVVTLLQNKPTPDPRTFLGEGKVAELRELIVANDCDLAVFDNELSPSQMRVLEEELGVRVLDRSGLILDIFAQRAQTREGQLQVELAQYQYLLPRLTGMWTHLVRQTASGGSSPIGTRGPGETQLETAARSRSCRPNSRTCARFAARSAAAARKTLCRSWPSSAIRTPENPHCSTA